MNHTTLHAASALCALAFLSVTARSQSAATSPISTDRPGFLFSPSLVPVGHAQVEAGLPTYARFESGGETTRSWSLPVALRYGLSSDVELRASLPTWTDAFAESGGADEGLSDVEVGVKVALDRSADTPLALQASLRLPTGADGFTTDELGGSMFLLHSRAIGGPYALTALLGTTWAPVDDGPDAWTGSLGSLVSRPIADEVSAFAELVALPGISEAAGQAYAGGGVIWTPREDLQLDLSADFGLDDDAVDVIAAVGISFRW